MNEKHVITRRNFVKSSTLAAGGLLASASLSAHPLGWLDGDDTIRVGLIGCGGRGTGAAVQALSTRHRVKLVAMADAFPDNVEKSYQEIISQEYTDPATGKSVDAKSRIDVPQERRFHGFDAYKQVIPLVDVVILATPPGFRPSHFEACVNAGKHVFMEKPVATDAPGIRRVLAAAEQAKAKKLNVVVGLQRHYQTVYREWVKRIHDGEIGEVHTARVYWNSSGVWVRDRAGLEAQAGRKLSEMEYQMRNWYYFNWLCGDHITEQHIHNLDVGNWVMQGHPVSAHGFGGREVRKGKDHGEIFDHHFVEYEFANGTRMFSQCRHQPGCLDLVTEGFQGSKGRAPKPGLIETNAGIEIWKHDARKDPNPYQVEHDELFEAVAQGEHRFSDAENGAIATMTAILGRLATYSGKRINWEDAMKSEVNLFPDSLAWDANPKLMPDAQGMYPVAMPGVTEVL
ncbi:MAG: Gfo/Idh/MocA family oxidoreductase [Bacteroidia bacterium]|nr:Gfo/Idh/MocA family oxidoreductase [Bacteroidia bacterium]